MAVYNFAFVGLSDVTNYTQELSNAIKTTALHGYVKRSYAVYSDWARDKNLLEASIKEIILNRILLYSIYILEVNSQNIEDLNNIDKTKKRFSPIYLYAGIYCFIIIFVGGLMEADNTLRNRLFHFINVYNLTTIIPILYFFLFVQKRHRKVSFTIIFIVHFIVVFYTSYKYCFPPVYLKEYNFLTEKLLVVELYERYCFMILFFMYMFFRYLRKDIMGIFSWRILGEFVFGIISIEYFINIHSETHGEPLNTFLVTTSSVIVSLTPFLLLLFRASIGAVFERITINIAYKIVTKGLGKSIEKIMPFEDVQSQIASSTE